MISKDILLITFANEFKLIILRTIKRFKVLLCITNSSTGNISQLLTQLNGQKVLFLTILFSISHWFALSVNVKQFYFTHR